VIAPVDQAARPLTLDAMRVHHSGESKAGRQLALRIVRVFAAQGQGFVSVGESK
jgi:hypothetical protein